jgi:hypothetical protein
MAVRSVDSNAWRVWSYWDRLIIVRQNKKGRTMSNGETPKPPAAGTGKAPKGYAPTAAVTAGGVAGAISVLLVWVANTFCMPETKAIPPEIASAITTILAFVVSYYFR